MQYKLRQGINDVEVGGEEADDADDDDVGCRTTRMVTGAVNSLSLCLSLSPRVRKVGKSEWKAMGMRCIVGWLYYYFMNMFIPPYASRTFCRGNK